MTTETTIEARGSAAVPDLIPARMLNEFAYCPRLAWLEWVQGEWEDSSDTVEGDRVHRRFAQAEGPRAILHQRSVHLSIETPHLTAMIDLLERDGHRVRPIEYKKGRKPPVAGGAWEPERVQLCAQGLLLREHGYECHEGVLYFAASRERVRVCFTDELVNDSALDRARQQLAAQVRRCHPERERTSRAICSGTRTVNMVMLPGENNPRSSR